MGGVRMALMPIVLAMLSNRGARGGAANLLGVPAKVR
jgi:hypothetical protein